MAEVNHKLAAEHHEVAAHTHRLASDLHAKGDHKAGLLKSLKARHQSMSADTASSYAHAKSLDLAEEKISAK